MTVDDLPRSLPSDFGPESMADSVTRHALISQDGSGIDFLIYGIDTLDVGFYVHWGPNWEDLRAIFDREKEKARDTNGHVIQRDGLRHHIFLPGGQGNYRYHLHFPEYHAFIAITEKALFSPNLYISFTSQALHLDTTPEELIELVRQDVCAFGGQVFSYKISRCDLYKDFRIPGGLDEDYIRIHMVSRTRSTNTFRKDNKLETFYAGAKGSALVLRLYDKGKKVLNSEDEERWKVIWFTDDVTDIWRVEFQARRNVIKQFGINSIEDLRKKQADLWEYMTGPWFSLRNLDSENQSRRTMTDFWALVHDSSPFGSKSGAIRQTHQDRAWDRKWYLHRMNSLIIPYSALTKKYTWEDAIRKLIPDLTTLAAESNFKEAVQKKSIEMGIEFETEQNVDRKPKEIREYFE
jgi:hypothetical protein